VNQKPIRVGIVGAGYVSSYHIRAIQSTGFAVVVGIADSNRERAESVAKRFGIPAVYDSLRQLLSAAPDVVHILTPPDSHCALAIEALQAGSHVMVEKPMAESAADCDRMIAAAHARGRILSVNHSARMDPIVLRALDQVRRGAIGDVLGVDFFRSSDYPAWAGGPMPAAFRDGSYPFRDLGVHALYLLEAFLGELRAVDIRYRSTGRDPNLYLDEWRGTVSSHRASGGIVLSWNVRPIQNELVIHGSAGVMHVDCFLQTCTIRKTYPLPKAIGRMLGAGLNSLSLLRQVTSNGFRFVTGKLRPSPGIHESVVRFYHALRDGAPPPVPADEGRRMVAWMEEIAARADEEKRKAFVEAPPAVPPRILVTGATGFLGRALVSRLSAAGNPIRILQRRPDRGHADPATHIVYGDLGDPAAVDRAVAGVEVVYHVGAAMKGWSEDFQRGTVAGTQHIVDSCLRHGVKRLVYVSSLSVLDHAAVRRGLPFTETALLEPHPDRRGAYSQTKLAAEALVRDAVQHRGLPAVILRPGQIFGPGAEKVVPSGAFGLLGRWIVNGSGKIPLPLVFVEDVVDALLLAERNGAPGEIFHIVDPRTVDQRTYLLYQSQWAKAALGAPTRVLYAPQWLLLGIASLVEAAGILLHRSVPLTRYRIRSLPPLWPLDSSAAQNTLSWTPRIGVLQGLKLVFGGSPHPE
jgi:predicted dehydrogenase/nucleoside-diphosphate-sugar epimerase